MQNFILEELDKTSRVLQLIRADQALLKTIEEIAQRCYESLSQGKKILLAGNGGSAADAQHLAAELVGRLHQDRKALPALALTTDTSILTAVSNDYGFEHVFARQIEAFGQPQDLFFAISTSGNSRNILAAIKAARQRGLIVVGFTGQSGGAMKDQCDYLVAIPTVDTQKIQEAHIILGHIICGAIDKRYFQPKSTSHAKAITA